MNVKEQGFLLLELSIVLALIVLIAGLSISLLSTTDNLYVRLEIEKLYTYALYLQRTALINKEEQKLIFNIEHNSYLAGNREHSLYKKIRFGFIEGAYGPPYAQTDLLQKPISFKNNTIIFYPDGTISSGVVYLTNIDKSIGYALSSGVSAISYLRCYKYDKKWVLIN